MVMVARNLSLEENVWVLFALEYEYIRSLFNLNDSNSFTINTTRSTPTKHVDISLKLSTVKLHSSETHLHQIVVSYTNILTSPKAFSYTLPTRGAGTDFGEWHFS